MADKTLKGQETYIVIVANGVQQARINDIVDTEITIRFEVKEKQYLGQTAPRYDAIYMGSQLKLTGNLSNTQFFSFVNTWARRTRRELGPGVRFEVGTTMRFDNGELGTFIFSGLEFSDIPINIGGRDEDAEWTLDGQCSEFVYVG